MPKFALINTPTFNSTTPNKGDIILVPDIKLISSFLSGDLSKLDPAKYNIGFSNNMIIDNYLNNVSKCKNLDDIKIFTKSCNIETKKDISSYYNDNKFEISKDDITISNKLSNKGVNALEKSVIQSIFESQKPYMSVILYFISNMVLIEDIIANVLCVSGSSLNPKRNPKALGYNKNVNTLKKSLSDLNRLSNLKPNINNTIDINNITQDDTNTSNIKIEKSIEYSTGEFIEGVDYEYVYKYINEFLYNPSNDEYNIDDDIDEYEKPETIVFGMYDDKGNIIDDVSVPYWLKESGKWYGQFDTLKSFNYIWVRRKNGLKVNNLSSLIFSNNKSNLSGIISDKKVQYEKPDGDGWERLKYDRSINIGGSFFKKGDYITIFDESSSDFNDYLDSYLYELDKLPKSNDYNIDDIKKDIKKILVDKSGDDISDPNNLSILENHLQNIQKYNFVSTYEGPKIPIVKVPLKTKKINFKGNDVYIDPESEYDLKVIKIDTYKRIKYYDNVRNDVFISEFSRFDDAFISIKLFTNDHYVSNLNNITYNDSNNSRNLKFSAKVYINNQIYNEYVDTDEVIVKKDFTTNDFYQIEFYYATDRFGKKIKYYDKLDLGNLLNDNDHRVNIEVNQIITDISSQYINNSYQFNVKNTNDKLIISKNDKSSVTNKIVVLTNGGIEKFIDKESVINDHLRIKDPYSKGEYGSDENPTIEKLFRYKTSSIDSGTIYLIEGILSKRNNGINSPDKSSVNFGGGSSRNYKKPWHVFKAIPKFIKLITRFFTKLIPSIIKLLKLLTNPIEFSTFVFDILINKIGDANGTEDIKFEIFSKRFKDEFNKIKGLNISNKLNFISNSNILKDYVTIVDNKEKFIFDGVSTLSFLKINMSILLNGLNFKKRLFNYKVDIFNSIESNNEINLKDFNISKYNLNNKLTNDFNVNTQYGNIDIREYISVKYSTGEFIEGINYEYTYVNEFISIILSEANEMYNSGDIDNSLYLYNILNSLDPNNNYINEKINDINKDRYVYNSNGNNPILSTILNMFTFPLKIIKDIIEDLLKLIKSITSPFSLPGKISEIMSFSWITDKFSNESILKYIGIKFDIGMLSSWNSDKLKDNMSKNYNLSNVLDLSFTPKLPTYKFDQFKDLKSNIHTNNLKSILTMTDSISNSFIDFIWALLGLSSIISKKKINNSSVITSKISNDIIKLLLDNVIISDNIDFNTLNNSSFIYDIQIGDKKLLDLDYNELEEWLSENSDKFNILFNF